MSIPHKTYVLLFFLASFGLGIFVGQEYLPSPSSASSIRQGGYSFINPLLECETAEGRIDSNLTSFRSKVEKLIDKKIDDNQLSQASIYFRDLNNGPWFGIHEREEFIPASLLKVPVVMTYFKIVEFDNGILGKKLEFPKKFDPPPGLKQDFEYEEIQPGNTYSIRELIERTMRYSDNQAASLLYSNLTTEAIRDVYGHIDSEYLARDLGVLTPSFSQPKKLTVKQYAGFFRLLFNSSYLDKNYSEEMLKYLSQTEFKKGLQSGVPENIVVAHKFGEASEDGFKQLHDCGIIYYPEHPYLLCVMTRGTEVDNLLSSIEEISRVVYGEVDKQNKNTYRSVLNGISL